jgi:hypothetical protein
MSEAPLPQRMTPPGARDADKTPLPIVSSSGVEPRVVDAWCEWLGALAKDAEAALAAAMAYKELDGPARDKWLGALEHDSHRVSVPRIAVYAPLLAVESDPDRRARITEAIGPADVAATPRFPARGMWGLARDGTRIAAIVTPLYLDFVQVLACGFAPRTGFYWVRHDPIVDQRRAPVAGDKLSGVMLESVPLRPLIDELAHAVLSHQRSGRELPEALRVFADLFGPGVGEPPASAQ